MWQDWHLRRAARVVGRGGVIAYPTEAVWGLGCNPWNPAAVARILDLKGRPASKGLIVIAATVAQLSPYVVFPSPEVRAQVVATWPGPVTWILPVTPGVPAWLRGGRGSLAVRVTAHPVAAALCRLAGPLVSTSANPAGRSPARSVLAVHRYFGARIDYRVPGATGSRSRPTEIRDARTGLVLRHGSS